MRVQRQRLRRVNAIETKLMKIPIRNRHLPQEPRVFDVTVDTTNKSIVRVDMQNIRGRLFVEREDVIEQIDEALNHIENI